MSTRENEIVQRNAEVRQDALVVLEDAAGWELDEPQWNKIRSILDRFEAALLTPDYEVLHAAVIDLEMASPFRVPPIRRPVPDEHAAQQLQDRLDRLVHKLNDLAQPDDEDDRDNQE